jgi:hypothetical protein
MRKGVLHYLAISFGVVLPCLAQGLGTDNARTENNRNKSPVPVFDITAHGARAVASGFSTKASCNGTKAITLAEASSFRNGDGITIYRCGATNTLSTPGAPIVTPSIASAGTATGIVTDSATGSTTASYKIVARDKFGALTAAGPATTITTGQATLGLNTTTITTCTRSNATVTCHTSAPSLIAAGSLVHITGASNPQFDGWYSVSSLNSSSEFVITSTPIDSRGIGWQFGDSASSRGGTAAYYLSNHITWKAVTNAWEYYIYMQAGGAGNYKLIGQTLPSGDGWIDTQFDDYGSTYMAGQVFPDYVPATAPYSATNDPLTTTIVSGAGTTSIVVANAASQTASVQTAWFDDGPAILAAATAAANARETLYIPAGFYYPIHSYTAIPSLLTIKQGGHLQLFETISLGGSLNWFGDWGTGTEPQFGFIGSPTIGAVANPGIYMRGNGNYLAYLGIISGNGTNGGTAIVGQDMVNAEFDYDYFLSNGGNSSDYVGRNIVFRSTSSGGNNYHFRKTLFSGGPNQVTDKSWTPLIYFPPNQDGSGGFLSNQNYEVRCLECFLNRRGWEEDNHAGTVGTFEFSGGYRQGGITPFLMVGNSYGGIGGSIMFHNVLQDTESAGSVALLSHGGNTTPIISLDFVSNTSNDVNGPPPPITGQPIGVHSFGSATGRLPTRDTETSNGSACTVTYPYAITGTNLCISSEMKKFFEVVDFPAGHSVFWDLPAPTGVRARMATSGGSLTAGTYFYTVSATGPDGGETVPATVASSSTTAGGNLTIPLSWTGESGAVTYNVYRCQTSCVYSDGRIENSGNWRQIARLISGTSLNDTGLGGTQQPPPTQTGTGSVGINAKEMYSPIMVLTPVKVASLPAAAPGNAGQMRVVNDSTAVTSEGQTCTGSSTNTALAFSNGSVWKCF